jgi:class 3 adenylate cyclase
MLLRELLEAILMDANYDVVTASDGQAGLDAVTAHKPDLVLLDVQMPRMDGYEVCKRLKDDPRTQFLPVVMVTALEGDEDKIKAIEAGADDFVTKPYNSYMLLTRVKSLLRIKHLNDELEERNALLRKVLNRYVNEDIADVILADPERHLKLGGETRPVTILFADIRGFTHFSEQRDAQEVVHVLNHVFSKLTQIILARKGTLDKYVGDEVMAFFGAPLSHPEDALNAIRAADEMQQAFMRAITSATSHDVREMGLGVGLCTGPAAVGNIGSEHLMNYTAIGDVVNTAHRLVEIAKPGQILLSETTLTEVAEHVKADPIPARVLPGKDTPITIYDLQEVL